MPDLTENPAATEQDFTITRVFDAPRELIWSALTDPEQLIRFWGPEGTHVPIESVTVEPRQGGVFQVTMVLRVQLDHPQRLRRGAAQERQDRDQQRRRPARRPPRGDSGMR